MAFEAARSRTSRSSASRELIAHRRLYVVEGIGACCLGSVERFLAIVAPDPGSQLESARAADTRAGAVVALGHTDELAGARAVLRRDGETWLVGWNGREPGFVTAKRCTISSASSLTRGPRSTCWISSAVGKWPKSATPNSTKPPRSRTDAGCPSSTRRSTKPTSGGMPNARGRSRTKAGAARPARSRFRL
jgi:hypothetical protein